MTVVVAGATLGDIGFLSYSEPKTCITQRVVVVIEIQLWRNNPVVTRVALHHTCYTLMQTICSNKSAIHHELSVCSAAGRRRLV